MGDEDSNSSWVSSSGRKRPRHHQGTGSHGPLSPGKTSHQTSVEGGTSESEEDTSAAKEKEKRRKVIL